MRQDFRGGQGDAARPTRTNSPPHHVLNFCISTVNTLTIKALDISLRMCYISYAVAVAVAVAVTVTPLDNPCKIWYTYFVTRLGDGFV